MSITINLLTVPPGGLQIHHEVEPSTLSLSPDEGTVIGTLQCRGVLSLGDERLAYFRGVVSGRVSRECVRCLAQFEETLYLPFDAQFQKPATLLVNSVKSKGGRVQDHVLDEDAPNEDVYPISGNDIDLLPAIREHVILATPLQPLCKEECQGLCQICGINLNERKCECYAPVSASSPVVSVKPTIVKKKSLKRSSVTMRRGS